MLKISTCTFVLNGKTTFIQNTYMVLNYSETSFNGHDKLFMFKEKNKSKSFQQFNRQRSVSVLAFFFFFLLTIIIKCVYIWSVIVTHS